MKISVLAKPKSKLEYAKPNGEASFIVAVKEVAEKGRANQAIIKALSEFFNIPASAIVLVSGQSSKQKVFEIPISLKEIKEIADSSAQMKLI